MKTNKARRSYPNGTKNDRYDVYVWEKIEVSQELDVFPNDTATYSEQMNNVLTHIWSVCRLLSGLHGDVELALCSPATFPTKRSPVAELHRRNFRTV